MASAMETGRFVDRCVQVQNALSLAFAERGGETNTQAALNLLHTTVFTAAGGARQGVPRIGVVVTDGHSTVLPDRTPAEAATARQSGVELFVVGVGEEVNLVELNSMGSTPTTDHVVMMALPVESLDTAWAILDQLCR